jgi:hypothetical protein
MNCDKSISGWFILVTFFLAWTFFLWVRSELKQRKERKARKAVMPELETELQTQKPCNIKLNDGTRFNNVMLLGTVDRKAGSLFLMGWENAFVLQTAEKNKIYIRSTAIRWIEEI